MKRIAIKILLAIPTLSLLLLGSCANASEYADDVSCAELMDRVEKQVPVDFGYETFGAEQIQFYFENTQAQDDACLRYSKKSEDINEIGIFHTPNEDARGEIETLIGHYLSRMKEEQSAFIASYAPKEIPKLEEAEYRSFGNYTVYVILDKDDAELVFETVEKELLRQE